MPDATPKGYPYPIPSDPVMNGDQAIEDLATFINNFIHGEAVLVPVVASSTGFVDIEFPAAYPVPPIVVSVANSPNYITGISLLDENGYRLTVQERDATSDTVNVLCRWIAIPA